MQNILALVEFFRISPCNDGDNGFVLCLFVPAEEQWYSSHRRDIGERLAKWRKRETRESCKKDA